jgi:hypothetical protein
MEEQRTQRLSPREDLAFIKGRVTAPQRLFELCDSACQLIWTGSSALAALDSLQLADGFIGVHALNERGDTFEIAVTAILKRHVIDAVIPYIKMDFS